MPIRLFEIVFCLSSVWRLRRAARPLVPQVRGFTLLRLLVVIALVGILSALAAPIVFPAHP